MIALSGVDCADKTRKRDVVSVRAMISRVLLAEGYTEFQVGEALGKNRATINHYKGKMRVFLSSPGYEAERELWLKFRGEI